MLFFWSFESSIFWPYRVPQKCPQAPLKSDERRGEYTRLWAPPHFSPAAPYIRVTHWASSQALLGESFSSFFKKYFFPQTTVRSLICIEIMIFELFRRKFIFVVAATPLFPVYPKQPRYRDNIKPTWWRLLPQAYSRLLRWNWSTCSSRSLKWMPDSLMKAL